VGGVRGRGQAVTALQLLVINGGIYRYPTVDDELFHLIIVQ
jgi:hypothetical protein